MSLHLTKPGETIRLLDIDLEIFIFVSIRIQETVEGFIGRACVDQHIDRLVAFFRGTCQYTSLRGISDDNIEAVDINSAINQRDGFNRNFCSTRGITGGLEFKLLFFRNLCLNQ